MQKLADAKGVTFARHITPKLVAGNAESLVQLLVIILDNAVKYGPAKGTVFLDGTTIDGHYALSIRDQGPGIAAADLPHIFERLYRGDKARTGGSGGYGLGLSLAQEIARAKPREPYRQQRPRMWRRVRRHIPSGLKTPPQNLSDCGNFLVYSV